MNVNGALVMSFLLLCLAACSSAEKVKPRAPLALSPSQPAAAIQHTEQGTQAYLQGRYDEAKVHFEQAVALAPASGEAHYNLGVALFALGASEQAREEFIQAANFAPGNKVIWDSPALRPFGTPDPNIKKETKDQGYSTQKPGFGSIGRR
ncbi:MAG: tetratricopeptide repeat protein [Nitrospiraceae bacterium]